MFDVVCGFVLVGFLCFSVFCLHFVGFALVFVRFVIGFFYFDLLVYTLLYV